MLRVQTTSNETIKPLASSSSSSTPPLHPKSIPLSLLDHLEPRIYIHLLLFYSSNPCNPNPPELKASLSETLKHFYPLAGRIVASQDDDGHTLHVDCTDDGVDFVEATAESCLDSLLLRPPIDQLTHLLPIKATKYSYGDHLLAVQLTAFQGGGFALGISICHLIADASSMAAFLNRWAGAARGMPAGSLPIPRFDSASVFPPRASGMEPSWDVGGKYEAGAVVVERFVVGPRAMERLRGGGYERAQPATRVEAVAALVWRCVVRARGGEARAAAVVVDLRRRISPSQVPRESFGNLVVTVAGRWEGGGRQGSLESAVRSAVRRADGEYARRAIEERSRRWEEGVSLTFSSWCRIPFYRADFGWGEPVWVGSGLMGLWDMCVLIDSRDGVGMEVWLWLLKEEMERIQRDPEFLGFVATEDGGCQAN